jgi:hypothetical protein
MASEAGKGSKQRPTNKEAYDEAYDRIWGKKRNQSYKDRPYKEGVAYDSDSEMLRDIRYDVKYIPEDHYEE